jgi:hypothetical protein
MVKTCSEYEESGKPILQMIENSEKKMVGSSHEGFQLFRRVQLP